MKRTSEKPPLANSERRCEQPMRFKTTLHQDLDRQKHVNSSIFYTNAIRLLKGMLQGPKQGHANINCETRVPRGSENYKLCPKIEFSLGLHNLGSLSWTITGGRAHTSAPHSLIDNAADLHPTPKRPRIQGSWLTHESTQSLCYLVMVLDWRSRRLHYAV